MNHSKFSAPKDRKKECGLDWHVAINKQPTAPIRAPVYSVYGFAKQTMAACRRIFSFSSPPPALFLTRRPLPWNHFLARPKPLSVLSSKMAAEHSKDYLSLAQPNTPALQATINPLVHFIFSRWGLSTSSRAQRPFHSQSQL